MAVRGAAVSDASGRGDVQSSVAVVFSGRSREPSLSCLHSASVTYAQQGHCGPAARRQLFTFSADTRSGWSKAPGSPARQLPTRGFNSESSSFPFLPKATACCFSCSGLELPQATRLTCDAQRMSEDPKPPGTVDAQQLLERGPPSPPECPSSPSCGSRQTTSPGSSWGYSGVCTKQRGDWSLPRAGTPFPHHGTRRLSLRPLCVLMVHDFGRLVQRGHPAIIL